MQADARAVIAAAAIGVATGDGEREIGVETMREGSAAGNFAPEGGDIGGPGGAAGADGMGAVVMAMAAAMPWRASCRASPIAASRPLTRPSRPAIEAGSKAKVPRLPALSVVTKLVGPDWAALLAAEGKPASV